MYPEDNISYDLKFYTTPKAVRLYTVYIDKQASTKPDADVQLRFIKKSLVHIMKYCTDQKITFDEYTSVKTNNLHDFILHLKNHQISPYIVLHLSSAVSIIDSYPKEELEFIFGEDIKEKLAMHRTLYYNSRKAKQMIEIGFTRLGKILNLQQKITKK